MLKLTNVTDPIQTIAWVARRRIEQRARRVAALFSLEWTAAPVRRLREAIAKPARAAAARKAGNTLRIADAERTLLRVMAANCEHEEIGGRGAGAHTAFDEFALGIKSQREMNEQGRGRTVWLGKPDWAKGWNMSGDQIRDAVNKALSGSQLGKRQLALIEAMLAEIAEFRAAEDWSIDGERSEPGGFADAPF